MFYKAMQAQGFQVALNLKGRYFSLVKPSAVS